MFHQIKVVVFSEIGGQVKCVESVSVFVVVARYAVAFVTVQFARTREQRVEGAYVRFLCSSAESASARAAAGRPDRWRFLIACSAES